MSQGTYYIHVHPSDVAFVKQAMLTPGSLPDDVDLVLGQTYVSDQISADLRLCGTEDGEPAHLCAAIFTKDVLLDYVRAYEFETVFILRDGDMEYEIIVQEDAKVPVAHTLLGKTSAS